MEYCDIYDGDRRPLGIQRARKEKLLPGEFKLVVGLWVFNSQRDILLTRRSPNKSFAPNLWENTGGHVAAGERVTLAAVRELQEETGIVATEAELKYIGCAKVPPFFGENYAIWRDMAASDVVLQEGETCDAKWVSLDEFCRMGDSGELAPSVLEHLSHMRAAFEALLLG